MMTAWPVMRKRVLPVLALSTCLVLPVAASAQERFAKECSAKDVIVITLIEDHGVADDVPAETLAQAHQAMLDARSTCADGRVGEALAIYNSILDLGPVALVRAQRQ